MFKASCSIPLGVDLVETKKAESFYKAHQSDLGAFFTKVEILRIKKCRDPYEKLALYLAAKEAIFKAILPTTPGMLEFRNIHIFQNRARQLSFELGGALKKCKIKPRDFKLSVVKKKRFIIVNCSKGA